MDLPALILSTLYPECWHFDSGASIKIDDVFAEHGGLLHILPLLSFMILVSAPAFLGLIGVLNWGGLGWGWAFEIWGLRVWRQGLTIRAKSTVSWCIFSLSQNN